ncbi:hypothetical protein SAMN05421595_0207 [Austwickia chelonae]|uniref:Uncharacterized protein n=1 Tax=Austwickia chelonae NBRC 105200 TaxID=1184607 RepID=K6WB03_9MICO|nr:hypothetical protein [Austwickia chelonae]GAB78992.1 hypothetical protein AUCHE_17_02080 [Austwickia chelonae NBRC 105200]SEV87936.1 hypothetical protein SAMN05421595_0207 [Austwickia chelonae]
MAEQKKNTEQSPPQVVHLRTRRTPKISSFLVTGAVLGMALGVLIDYVGPDSRCGEAGSAAAAACRAGYEPTVSLFYFLVLGALAGIGVAASVAVGLDWFLNRRR